MFNFKLILIAFLGILCCGQCYNFLGVFPIPIKSHMIVFVKLMKELAKKGHNVTVISTFPEKNYLPNYKDVDLSAYIPKMIEIMVISEERSDSKMVRYFGPTITSAFADVICEGLSSPPYQEFLKENSTFDAIIIESFNTECYVSIADKFKAPIIGFSSSGILSWTQERFGIPKIPSYLPDIFLGLSDKMYFFERVENTLVTFFHNLFHKFYRIVKDKEVVRRHVGSEAAANLDSLVNNMSLFLVNTHFTLNLPRPFTPNVIEVGGIHIEEPKALPKNLNKWIKDSPGGIIYFSMGSMTSGQTLPEKRVKAFINAFELLPHRVIWKWENETMEGKTDKILIQKWLPQLDILCQPNVKLFISHGGMLGIMEAVYCGVPILLIPQYGDQHANAKSLETTGAGVILRLSEVTKETAYQAMLKALHLSNEMKALSNRFKDRPLPPLETAVYWTEYVVRQNGAPFMKTAAVDMPFYQYYLLDVLLFILSILFLAIYILCFVVKFILGKLQCFTKSYKHKKA